MSEIIIEILLLQQYNIWEICFDCVAYKNIKNIWSAQTL